MILQKMRYLMIFNLTMCHIVYTIGRLKRSGIFIALLLFLFTERRMAKAENTRATTRINETWCLRNGSHGTFERTQSSITSITGEVKRMKMNFELCKSLY